MAKKAMAKKSTRKRGPMYFPQEEYETRWANLHRAMRAKGYEVALVWGKTAGTFERSMDTVYLTNFFSTHSGQEPDSLVWNARSFCGAIVEVGKSPELHTDEADPQRERLPIDNYHSHLDPIQGIADALKKRRIQGKVAWVGSDTLPVKYAEQLRKATPGIDYVYEDDLVRDIRLIKSPRELDMFREGGEMVTAALTKLIKAMIAGKTEAEAAAAGGAELLRRGGYWHRIAISHGKKSAYPESNPLYGFSQDAPKVGDICHAFIYGPIWQGYWLDPGRSFICGRKPSAKARKLIEDCVKVMEAIEEKVKPGARHRDVSRHARKVHDSVKTEDCFYDTSWPYYGHSNGCLWEKPFLLTDPDKIPLEWEFKENMVASSEAFLTRTGVGTVSFETNWIVTKTGIEKLTPLPMIWF
jgi:Xaa-Pro aminopeptidase